jgi:hypothetical protein
MKTILVENTWMSPSFMETGWGERVCVNSRRKSTSWEELRRH